MIKFSSSHIKKKIGFELLDRCYGIKSDKAMSEAVFLLMGDDIYDEELCFYEFENVIPFLFDFEIEWIGIPDAIADEQADGYNYWLQCGFRIPELIPHTKRADFDKLIDDITYLSVGGCYANCIELVYLPDSNFVTSDEPVHQDFGNQPGTFILGVQDNGGLRQGEVIEFLNLLRDFNSKIKAILNGEEREK